MYKVLVVEDDKVQLAVLVDFIKRVIPESEVYTADGFHSAHRLINVHLFDLFFLDIILSDRNPENDGIRLAHMIRKKWQNAYTPIVFVTIKPEDIMQAINQIHCHSYIIKPICFEDIQNAINNAIASPTAKSFPVDVRDQNGISFSVNPQELLYISSLDHQLFYVTEKGTFTSVKRSLSYIEEKLGSGFVRVHRSYLVNLRKIRYYDRTDNMVRIGKDAIPIGRAFKNHFLEKYANISRSIK